ncbi:MAG: hypothetical protein IKX74_01615 [Erysipelotrichaceae bacterium]|nr:hypothetical protein [Erysipelotrichaceae bacterium]
MKKLGLLLLAVMILTGCSSIHSHSWAPANYQQPSTCSTCGQTQGEAKTADFEKYKIKANPLTADVAYEYHTICSETDDPTAGSVSVASWQVFASDETHQARNGYQWQVLTLKLKIGNEASNQYGFRYNYVICDYYDIESFSKSYEYDEEKQYNTFTVNYFGKDYEDCRLRVICNNGEWLQKGLSYYKNITVTFEALLPEGYDGLVVGLRDSSVSTEGKYYLNQYYEEDSFVLFRMGAVK